MNDYLEDFRELQEKNTFKGQQWFGERQQLVEEYGWAIPNEDALLYLSEFDELVSIGSGKGYWEHCIEQEGGEVRATDIDPPEETYTEVDEAAVDDLDLGDAAVLTIWPPCGHPKMAETALHQKPPHILYVGEPKGGCTASNAFFDTVQKKYGLVAKIDIPSYAGVNDDLFHYVRNV